MCASKTTSTRSFVTREREKNTLSDWGPWINSVSSQLDTFVDTNIVRTPQPLRRLLAVNVDSCAARPASGKRQQQMIVVSYTSVKDEADSCCNLSYRSKDFVNGRRGRCGGWPHPRQQTSPCVQRHVPLLLSSTPPIISFSLCNTRAVHIKQDSISSTTCAKKERDVLIMETLFSTEVCNP